jgi:hypothetical protein
MQTREEYRDMLRALHLIEADQDVYHIISRRNGGADHISNYHYAQNRHLNRAIGEEHDYLNAYLAGLEKTKVAVAVSMKFGNAAGKKYTGQPSAEELCKKGKEALRLVRLCNRGWHAATFPEDP